MSFMLCPVLFFTDSCMATVTCPEFDGNIRENSSYRTYKKKKKNFSYRVKFGSGNVLAIPISCFLRTLLNFGVEYGYED